MTIGINDAVHVLMYLAKMPSSEIIRDGGAGSRAWKAAMIVAPGTGDPTIQDAVQILMHLAKMSNSRLFVTK